MKEMDYLSHALPDPIRSLIASFLIASDLLRLTTTSKSVHDAFIPTIDRLSITTDSSGLEGGNSTWCNLLRRCSSLTSLMLPAVLLPTTMAIADKDLGRLQSLRLIMHGNVSMEKERAEDLIAWISRNCAHLTSFQLTVKGPVEEKVMLGLASALSLHPHLPLTQLDMPDMCPDEDARLALAEALSTRELEGIKMGWWGQEEDDEVLQRLLLPSEATRAFKRLDLEGSLSEGQVEIVCGFLERMPPPTTGPDVAPCSPLLSLWLDCCCGTSGDRLLRALTSGAVLHLQRLVLYGCILTRAMTTTTTSTTHRPIDCSPPSPLESLCLHMEQGGWPDLQELRLMRAGLTGSHVARLLDALHHHGIGARGLRVLGLHGTDDGVGVATALVEAWSHGEVLLPMLEELGLSEAVGGGGVGVVLAAWEEAEGRQMIGRGRWLTVNLKGCGVTEEEQTRLRMVTEQGGPRFITS